MNSDVLPPWWRPGDRAWLLGLLIIDVAETVTAALRNPGYADPLMESARLAGIGAYAASSESFLVSSDAELLRLALRRGLIGDHRNDGLTFAFVRPPDRTGYALELAKADSVMHRIAGLPAEFRRIRG